jgi:hypothetical protein
VFDHIGEPSFVSFSELVPLLSPVREDLPEGANVPILVLNIAVTTPPAKPTKAVANGSTSLGAVANC